ncbi:MAG: HTH domain-containing protein [Blautia sp.]
MSKVKFTEEQQQELRNNKYTAKVTANSLSFTKEFKELFYNEYLTGVLPREILRRYGYLDAFTKQVLSYVISDSLEVDFVLETVNQLMERQVTTVGSGNKNKK